MIELLLQKFWYQKREPGWVLRSLNRLSKRLVYRRRAKWRYHIKPEFSVPVVVVGNISVGGAGKTPAVVALTQWFESMGLKVGIVSRGYGAWPPAYPFSVTPATEPKHGGDEPCMMAQRLGCPVVIDPDRPAAVTHLVSQWPDVDIILSDDGLQHYRMNRSVELVVVDARRGFGNGLCLPWGPLREPIGRLRDVAALIINGSSASGTEAVENTLSVPAVAMQLESCGFYRVTDGQPVSLTQLLDDCLTESEHNEGVSHESEGVVAVAGIGHPQRFFATLGQMGVRARGYAFKDHHRFKPRDFSAFTDARWVIMTEKDAVKVKTFAKPNWIFLAVEAQFSTESWLMLTERMEELLLPWPKVSKALRHRIERLKLRQCMHKNS